MRLAEVVAALEGAYPPHLAEPWDAVGLVCGDPEAEVRSVLFAVDPVAPVVDEAVAGGVDLVVTHHPLYLRGTSSVAATAPKGRVVHRLLTARCALFAAHTNADSAQPGVSDALADLFGLRELRPLQPTAVAAPDKLVVYVPEPDAPRLRAALWDAGAGRQGAYDRVAFTSAGTGTFRPLAGASPAVGAVGRGEEVTECRVEVLVERRLRGPVLAAMHAAHPYEEVAYDLLERVAPAADTGLGRVGELPEPLSLRELVERAAGVLPATAWGVRAAGDPERTVTRLAVCGGAGDSLLGAAAACGAQAYLTGDLRHHTAAEAPDRLALLDAAHWATEWPWLPVAADRLGRETGLATRVSTVVTDPFGVAARS
ncbi:MAG: Nif3-like dinuclear metal center hexameric protein [Actinomycetota bacterium]|nr:Nif3-like dinuclear metal center hexameric protein [Actinomycetota bacterium]